LSVAGAQQKLWYDQFPVGEIIPEQSLRAIDVGTDPVGNVYVAGHADDPLPGQSTGGAFIRKYDPTGAVSWTRQFAGAHPLSIAVDGSAGTVITGIAEVTLPGSSTPGEAFVRRYDAAGNEVWTRQFGAPSGTTATSVSVDGSGNAYVAGTVFFGALPGQTWFGDRDGFVRKYDSAGNELWTRQFGTTDDDGVFAGDADAAGNVYVTGTSFGHFPGGTAPNSYNTFVKKFDSNGTSQWVRQFGTEQTGVEVNDIAEDSLGNIYVLGFKSTQIDVLTLRTTTYLRKLRANGSTVYQRDYHFPTEALFNVLGVDGSGRPFLAGAETVTDLAASGRDVLLVKFETDGKEIWRSRIEVAGDQDRVDGISIDGGANILLAGVADQVNAPMEPITGDAFVMKVDQSPTCVGTSNPTENEDGLLSRPIHQTLEQELGPLEPTVHEVNCTIIAPAGL